MDWSGAILSFLEAFVTKLGEWFIKIFTSFKTFWFTIITVTLPVIINNFIADYMTDMMTFLNSLGLDAEWSNVAEYTGLMGWLIDCFQIPEVLSILLAALSMHLLLKMIPFSPIK